MFFVRQNSTQKVMVGPTVAVADGFTPVVSATLLSDADEAYAILSDESVVDISGYTCAAVANADGYHFITLQTGISDTVGPMTIVVNDDDVVLPILADFTVVEEVVYDAFYKSGATGLVPANVMQIDGQPTSGNNATLIFRRDIPHE